MGAASPRNSYILEKKIVSFVSFEATEGVRALEMTGNQVGASEVAALFGVTERTVQQLAKDGTITAKKKRPYEFDLYDVAQEYIQYLSDKVRGREKKASGSVESEKLRAEADFKRSKADMAALQLKELEGEMHRSDDVEAMMDDLVYSIRSMILALPGRLAMDIIEVDNTNEASAMIRKECHAILNELAQYQYNPEEYRRRVRERIGWRKLVEDEADEEA